MAKKITDEERLDFVATKAWGVEYRPNERPTWVCLVGNMCDGKGWGPRSAIDAAIRAERRGKAK